MILHYVFRNMMIMTYFSIERITIMVIQLLFLPVQDRYELGFAYLCICFQCQGYQKTYPASLAGVVQLHVL